MATVIVVIILVGCKIVMDFPGLLEGNVVQVFKESKTYKGEPFEEVSVDKMYQAMRSAKEPSSDHQLRDDRRSQKQQRSGSRTKHKAVQSSLAQHVHKCPTEVKIIIKNQNDLSIEIDISPVGVIEENNKEDRLTAQGLPNAIRETPAPDHVEENEEDAEETTAECDIYNTKDNPDRQS